MMKVTNQDVTEFEPGRFVTEASSLGIGPGSWREFIPTNLGNGLDFRLVFRNPEKCVYTQEFGSLSLVVLND